MCERRTGKCHAVRADRRHSRWPAGASGWLVWPTVIALTAMRIEGPVAVVAVRRHCRLANDATADSRHGPSLSPPVSPACISSSFGPRVLPNQPEAGTYHYGVDLPAAEGAAVFAAAPGTVIRVQRNGPGGLEMLVQHDGFVGVYSHFGTIMPAFTEGKRDGRGRREARGGRQDRRHHRCASVFRNDPGRAAGRSGAVPSRAALRRRGAADGDPEPKWCRNDHRRSQILPGVLSRAAILSVAPTLGPETKQLRRLTVNAAPTVVIPRKRGPSSDLGPRFRGGITTGGRAPCAK